MVQQQQYSQHVEGKKNYHVEPTGQAKITANKHSNDADLNLFASCFCPFVHRAWIALEVSNLDYKLTEVDVYKKPKELLDVNPRGLVPALTIEHDGKKRALAESMVIIEFIDELATQRKTAPKGAFLPADPYERAIIRLQVDHINKAVIPNFYKYLQAQEPDKQIEGAKAFTEGLEKLISLFEEAQEQGIKYGLFSGSDTLSLADVAVAPWIFRSTNVLKHYRGFEPPSSAAYQKWAEKLLSHPAVLNTSSGEELYLDSYARYAENRPNTSRVAEAINNGSQLP